jgi:membrane protein DedA with SNARE-associated domain
MDIVQFISQYGYAAVLFGAMIEGESVLLAAAYAVHQHYLLLWPVILCGSLGAIVSDHLYFYVGRTQGSGWLMRHENVRRRAVQVQDLVQKHQTLLLMGFRFMVGFRTITPLLLGMGGVSRLRFLIFDSIASVVWATLITVLGNWILVQLQQLQWPHDAAENRIIWGLVILAALIGAGHLWWMRRKRP